MSASIDIIICVHNSLDDVRLAVHSTLDTLGDTHRLIIVDDGSDAPTQSYCREIADAHAGRVRLIRRPEGSGFCKAANHGLRESTAEAVVLLNSDTIVAGDWLARLQACAEQHAQIGIVGPLSNAASWQSLPYITDKTTGRMATNHVPGDPALVAEIHQHCARWAEGLTSPWVEVVNGFCYYIKRAVLDDVGLFDETRFPQGYGEENDLALRAGNAGYLCAIAIDCFVYHKKSASYSTARRRNLARLGDEELARTYGQRRIRDAVLSIQQHPTLHAMRARSEAYLRPLLLGTDEA
ncbi:MAG: glycosyltransferase family 2 protein [Geminicoccaceae bacterium]